MITKINLKGFLIFKNEKSIEFTEYVNVINRPPKSGKSAIIEGKKNKFLSKKNSKLMKFFLVFKQFILF